MLTKSDQNLIQHIVEDTVDRIVEQKTKHLATAAQEDRLLTELQHIRDDISVMAGWKDDIEESKSRIKRLEKHVGVSSTV